jgi:hypothetical protein
MADTQTALATTTPTNIPLPTDGPHSAAIWHARIKSAADRMRTTKVASGRENVKRYEMKTLSAAPTEDTVVVPDDFSNTEQKKAQLFFKSPDVKLKPTMKGLDQAVHLFEAVVNEQLGPDGADVESAIGEALFDLLCPAGFGATEIGYQSTTKPVKLPAMSAEAAQLAGIAPEMVPLIDSTATIHQRFFWERFSPGQLLYPDDFTASNFDKSPWIGRRFRADAAATRRQYNLRDDQGTQSTIGSDDMLMSEQADNSDRSTTPKLTITKLWYQAHVYDAAALNPELIREMVFVDGVDEPVIHRDSTYQQFDQYGRFQVGMRGYPVHVLTVRYVSDKPLPPSDCDISRVLVDEKSKFRTQMIMQRDRSLPQRWINTQRAGKEFIEKIRGGDWRAAFQALIEVDGDGKEVIGEISTARYPRENYTANDYCDRDIQKAWAMGSNQQGAETDTSRTATELSLIQGNTDVRLDYERDKVVKWFCKGAEKFASLIQLFADDTQYVEVLGGDAPGLQAWDKTKIQGRFVFTAKPDSAIRVDAAQERRSALDLYRVTANDPNVRRTELLKSIVQKYGFDPATVVAEELPEKGPEPPKVTLSISGADLAPTMPQYQACLAILSANGIHIDPAAAMRAAAEQGGKEAEHGGMQEMEAGLGMASTQRSGQLPGNAEATQRGVN